jgi:hypothetical protein
MLRTVFIESVRLSRPVNGYGMPRYNRDKATADVVLT